jgi:hypothetical protein
MPYSGLRASFRGFAGIPAQRKLEKKAMPTLPSLDITTRVNHSPHVVILGAGASKAAFPRGDPKGRVVPVMQQLVECLDLTASLKAAGFAEPINFEAIYDELASTGSNPALVSEIEGRVRNYFEAMVLPTEATLYDRLLLSMSETDLVATFNWDPFLPLAYARNAHIQRLPQLAFLHGNVEIAVCLKDRVTGFRWQRCQKCGNPLQPTKLLYPVRHKDYNTEPFIANEWKRLKWFLDRAYMLTVFGYGAPSTDVEAVDLMSNAWKNNPRFELGQVNIVDIRSQRELEKIWEPFFCRNHYATLKSFRGTWLFRHARRSCEALAFATLQMAPWKTNRLPRFKSLAKLHKWIEPLIAEETAGRFSGNPCPMT